MAGRILLKDGRKIMQKSTPIEGQGTDMLFLSTLFEQARTGCIVMDGRRIYSILRIPVAVPSLLRVRRLHASTDPVPGLQIATDDGTATLEGEKVPNLVTWSDINPEVRELHIIPKRKKTAVVSIWHVWRDCREGYDIRQAWLLGQYLGPTLQFGTDCSTHLR